MSTTPSLTYYGGHVAELAARLRAARDKTTVNAVTAARVMGMTPQRLSAIETGRIEAKARDVQLYARLTGADAADLLMGEDREPILVPDDPSSYRKSNGADGRTRSLAARQARHQRPPKRPGPEPAPSWRPANLGRDTRPDVKGQDQ